VREGINKRAHTLRGLGRSFKIIDDDGNRKIDKEEFYWGLKDNQIDITQREASILLQSLDSNGDGHVDFDEFLVGIRGKPNDCRVKYIHMAFAKFDKDANGFITADDLRGVYDCSMHPKIQNGELTEDEVFVEFLKNFGDKNGDGKITKSEWDDYYAAVSSNIDNDQHFIECMLSAWKLNE
jgi:Ca2+-binding EF-hand superfamily protein